MNVGKCCICSEIVLLLSLFAGVGPASAQAGHWPASSDVASASEEIFAKTLSAMTQEEATAAIEHAPAAETTPGLAVALRSIGVGMMEKQPSEAVRVYRIGLAVAAQLHAPIIEGSFQTNIGNAENVLGDYEAAIDAFSKAIPAYERGNAGPLDLGRVFGARGLAKRYVGDVEGAIQDGQHALELAQAADDTASIPRFLNNLGNAELLHGDYTQAREHFEWGLRLARAQKQRQGESFLLNNIANTYLAESNPQLAVDYCLQAIKIKEEIGNPADLANSLINLARIYEQLNRLKEASNAVARGHALAVKADRPRAIIAALEVEGTIEHDLEHDVAAEAKITDALALARKNKLRSEEAGALLQLSGAELNLNRNAEASQHAEQAIEIAKEAGSLQFTGDSEFIKGQAERRLGHLATAQEALEAAIQHVESDRDNVAGGDDARTQFFANYAPLYKELVSLDVQRGRLKEALQITEAEKGRVLLDMLTRGKPHLSEGLTENDRAEERRLNAHLATLEASQRRALANAADRPATKVLTQQLEAARAALRSFRERMYSAHPEMARHQGIVPLLMFDQTRSLLTRASVLLEYEVTPDATYLFSVTQGAGRPVLHEYTIAVPASQVASQVEQFRSALAMRSTDFAFVSASLYRLLLAPAKADLAGKRLIVVVPSGALWRLPFQALQTSSGKYLLQKTSIAYEPSLSILRASGPGHAPPGSLLAFGDPSKDLPEAEREIQGLTAVYGQHAKVFTGNTASIENFRHLAEHYRVIHLATHGVLDDRDPMYSHLLLASAAPRSADKGIAQLDAMEIAKTDIPASLVVLSGCATADGKFQEGEGLIGLSYSFLAAGARSVVASQWRVESASTSELMLSFHRHLHEGMSKSLALRSAELEVLRNPEYRHPFYWAGFVLFGQD